MKNPNGPTREDMEAWHDELTDEHMKTTMTTPPTPPQAPAVAETAHTPMTLILELLTANAAHIVRCVNSHEALAEELRSLVERCDEVATTSPDCVNTDAARKLLVSIGL